MKFFNEDFDTHSHEVSGRTDWRKEEILELIQKNDRMVGLSLLVIYKLQTEDEKLSDETRHDNGVGFNGLDAELLSSFARFFDRNGFLTEKQLVIGRNKIKKYANQLVKVANGEIII